MTTQYAVASKKYRDDLKVEGMDRNINIRCNEVVFDMFQAVPGKNLERLELLLKTFFEKGDNSD